MKKKIIVGNWKMNPVSLVEAKRTAVAIKRLVGKNSKALVVICPPLTYLPIVHDVFGKGKLATGAQDIFFEEKGSFTGEVSASMVRATGATHTIIGHSERRRLGESDSVVAKKVEAGLSAGLNVILCVGEHTRDEHGVYLAFIHEQLLGALSKIQRRFLKKLIVAYEPVWAIGRSEKDAITPHDLHEMALYIKKLLSDRYGEDAGRAVPILYGGAVFPGNAGNFVKEGGVDGLLIGRESLRPEGFAEILQVVTRVK